MGRMSTKQEIFERILQNAKDKTTKNTNIEQAFSAWTDAIADELATLHYAVENLREELTG